MVSLAGVDCFCFPFNDGEVSIEKQDTAHLFIHSWYAMRMYTQPCVAKLSDSTLSYLPCTACPVWFQSGYLSCQGGCLLIVHRIPISGQHVHGWGSLEAVCYSGPELGPQCHGRPSGQLALCWRSSHFGEVACFVKMFWVTANLPRGESKACHVHTAAMAVHWLVKQVTWLEKSSANTHALKCQFLLALGNDDQLS